MHVACVQVKSPEEMLRQQIFPASRSSHLVGQVHVLHVQKCASVCCSKLTDLRRLAEQQPRRQPAASPDYWERPASQQ